jgi:multidrug efflux pump subunit AcrB
MAAIARQVSTIPEAIIFPFNVPTISGFGASAGFKFLLQDKSGSLTVEQLGAQVRSFLQEARTRPELGSVFTSFDPNYPQVKVELDRAKARSLGVPIDDVFQAMSAALGGAYVNDFNRFGRLYRVYVQAEADYRRKPKDIGEIFVRSKTTGTMIPLSTLVSIEAVPGSEITTRFNLFRSVEISGAPARGYTSGQALAALGGVRRDDAEGDGLRVFQPVLPGRRPRPPRPRSSWPSCSCSCCWPPCTKLAPAVGGAPRLAAGRPRRLPRRVADGLRQQRVRQIDSSCSSGLAARTRS